MTPHGRRALAVAAAVAAIVVGCGPGGDAPGPVTPAPAGTVVHGTRGVVEHVMPSGNSFGESGDYSIYLPPGYGEDARRRYPVVYLLHGGSEGVTFFLDLGIQRLMDDALASGAVGPMLLVLVDGGPMFTGKGDTATGFDDYLARELIPDVDHRWRTVAGRGGRAIGGVSVGGRHALEFAGGHRSLFAAAGGHSTTVPRWPEKLAAAGIPVYLDVGERDGLLHADEALAGTLRRLGADVRWHPAPGGHERSYWSAHLLDYLRFYSDALGAHGK